MRFTGAIFPLKNSDAESEGSSEGAGGKISAWKLSAYKESVYPGSTTRFKLNHLPWNDKSNRFDGGGIQLVNTGDFTFLDIEGAAWQEAGATLGF